MGKTLIKMIFFTMSDRTIAGVLVLLNVITLSPRSGYI